MKVYLDSSSIVKRYVWERGTGAVRCVYELAYSGDVNVVFSLWNIGEVLTVLDKYLSRKWLSSDDYARARGMFLAETLRLVKLKALSLIPLRVRLVAEAWPLIEKYHVYEADALQVVSAKISNAQLFLTADKRLLEVVEAEGIKSFNVEVEERRVASLLKR